MNGKFKRVKELTKISGEISRAVKKLNDIAKALTHKDDKNLQAVLSTLIIGYSRMNFMFAIYLMNLTPESLKSDEIYAEFEKLMKPLEKDIKKRNKDKKGRKKDEK